jgi:hypothetical protein
MAVKDEEANKLTIEKTENKFKDTAKKVFRREKRSKLDIKI